MLMLVCHLSPPLYTYRVSHWIKPGNAVEIEADIFNATGNYS